MRMNYSLNVINKFGGVQPLRRALGHKNPTTVHHWKQTGTIPQKHWKRLMDLAKDQEIDLRWSDFVDDCEEESA